jgi:tRNA nucleotidyltransferase (CCA-adding enzyme)
MKCYLVGGAVRDQLLGLPVSERDWVVVGATPAQMGALGYHPVGKDFPVFLHPDSKEEYALARTERKRGHGYRGFEFNTDSTTTLEQDLWRRDLTVNAIAQDAQGRLIDPHGGLDDLQHKILRHVSPAFVEDPLRVLRLARFAARFAPLGFRIAPETQQLIREISAGGELDHLVAERIWKETERALCGPNPEVYFQTLKDNDALSAIMPELQQLFGVPQRARHHPEIDTGVHSLMVLAQAAKLSPLSSVRFAALVHDLGKGSTPPSQWPDHRAHEERGVPLIEQLATRWRIPQAHADLARLCCLHHGHAHRATDTDADALLQLLYDGDALRRPERFAAFLLCCEADSRGRLGHADQPYPQADLLREASAAIAAVDPRQLVATGLSGKALGNAIRAQRRSALQTLLEQRHD